MRPTRATVEVCILLEGMQLAQHLFSELVWKGQSGKGSWVLEGLQYTMALCQARHTAELHHDNRPPAAARMTKLQRSMAERPQALALTCPSHMRLIFLKPPDGSEVLL